MYQLKFSHKFDKQFISTTSGNPTLEKRIKKTLFLVSENPYHPSLRTHKVDSKEFTDVWSSWVTGDLRIIWEYDNTLKGIIIIQMGSHSGGNKTYK